MKIRARAFRTNPIKTKQCNNNNNSITCGPHTSEPKGRKKPERFCKIHRTEERFRTNWLHLTEVLAQCVCVYVGACMFVDSLNYTHPPHPLGAFAAFRNKSMRAQLSRLERHPLGRPFAYPTFEYYPYKYACTRPVNRRLCTEPGFYSPVPILLV